MEESPPNNKSLRITNEVELLKFDNTNGQTVLIYPQGSGTVVCNCLASWRLEGTSQDVYKKLKNHFQVHAHDRTIPNNQQLEAFTKNAFQAAVSSTHLLLPFNPVEAFGLAAIPSDLKTEDVNWCSQCGNVRLKNSTWPCKCGANFSSLCKGIVGDSRNKFRYLITKFPESLEMQKVVFNKRFPPINRVEAQAILKHIRATASPLVPAASSSPSVPAAFVSPLVSPTDPSHTVSSYPAAPSAPLSVPTVSSYTTTSNSQLHAASLEGNFTPFHFSSEKFHNSYENFRSSDSNTMQSHTHLDVMTRHLRLQNCSNVELFELKRSTEARDDDVIQKNLRKVAFQLGDFGNHLIGKANPVVQSQLYQFFGPVVTDGDSLNHSKRVEQVTPSTIQTYSKDSFCKVVNILYNTDRDFKNEILLCHSSTLDQENASMSWGGGEQTAEVGDLLQNLRTVVLGYIFNKIIFSPTQQEIDDWCIKLSGLFLTCAYNEEVEEEDDDDDDVDDLSEDFPARTLLTSIASCKRGQSIASALRFMFLAVTLTYFDAQTTYPTFTDFFGLRSKSQVPRVVNTWISEFKKHADSQAGSSYEVNINYKPGEEVEFLTFCGPFTMDSFRTALTNVKLEMSLEFKKLFSHAVEGDSLSEVCGQWIDRLIFDHFSEGDWKLECSQGSTTLAGAGFGRLREMFTSILTNIHTRQVGLQFIPKLRTMVSLLISLVSSAQLRLPTLLNIFVDPTNAANGNVRVVQSGRGLFNGYSYLELNGTDSKKGGKTSILGTFPPRLSKLAALPLILIPQILSKTLIPEWLNRAMADPNDKPKYTTHLTSLLFSQKYEPTMSNSASFPEFDSLTRAQMSKTLKLLSPTRIKLDFLSGLRRIFERSNLTCPIFRKVAVNLNQRSGEILKYELEKKQFSPEQEFVVQALLTTISNEQSLGTFRNRSSGGGHSETTFLNNYAARDREGTKTLETQREQHFLSHTKCYLFRDFTGLASNEELTSNGGDYIFRDPFPSSHDAFVSAVSCEGKLEFTERQSEIILSSFGRQSNVVNVPCGGGKTWIQLLIAGTCTFGVTCILVPTRALLESVVEQAKKLDIGCAKFESGKPEFSNFYSWDGDSKVRVVAAVFDTSVKQNFLSWWDGMRKRGLAIRLVIDEIHEVFESCTYRSVMMDLGCLRQNIAVPITLMSGTLNQAMIHELMEMFHLPEGSPLIVSPVSLNNMWAFTTVQESQALTPKGFFEEAKTFVERQIRDSTRVMIVCYSKSLVKSFEGHLEIMFPSSQVKYVTADDPSEELKQVVQIYSSEENSHPSTILVSTPIFSVGVNFLGVSHVILLGAYSVNQVIQTWSRCGRGQGNEGKGKVSLLMPTKLFVQMEKKDSSFGLVSSSEHIFNSLRVNVGDVEGVQQVLGWKSVSRSLFEKKVCVLQQLEQQIGGTGSGGACGRCSYCYTEEEQVNEVLEFVSGTVQLSTFDPSRLAQVVDMLRDYSLRHVNSAGFICVCCQSTKFHHPNMCDLVKSVKSKMGCYMCGSDNHTATEMMKKDDETRSRNCVFIEKGPVCFKCLRFDCLCRDKGKDDPFCKSWETYKAVLFHVWFEPQLKEQLMTVFSGVRRCLTFRDFHIWSTQKWSYQDASYMNFVKVLVWFWNVKQLVPTTRL